MKKKILAMVLSMAMVFTMLPVTPVSADAGASSKATFVTPGDAPVENLARSATAAAEKINHTDVNCINNGVIGDGGWNSWNQMTEQDTVWASLTWQQPQTVISMRVMWWADNVSEDMANGVRYPKSAKVEYLNGESWQEISEIGVEHGAATPNNNVWNMLKFPKAITTTSLRIQITRDGTGASGVGIDEWEVFSNKTIDEAKISGPAELLIGNTETYTGSVMPQAMENSSDYAWSVPEDSQSLIQIEGAANEKNVSVKALAAGKAKLHLAATMDGDTQETDYEIHTLTEQERLNLDAVALQAPGMVSEDFELATTSKSGYDVTWKSDNDAIAIDGGNATVTVGDEGLKVKLTATVTGKDEVTPKRTAEKEFIVFVPSSVYLAGSANVTGTYEGAQNQWADQRLIYINDGDYTTAWNGWGRQGEIPTVDTIQYTFEDKLELVGSAIRFMSDGSGVVFPEEVGFEYYDDNASAWKVVTQDDGYSLSLNNGADRDNGYIFGKKIITNQIKLNLTNGKNGSGAITPAFIYEWALIGGKYVKPDLTSLNTLITQAEALDTSGMDAEKVAAFTAALEAAQAVAADKNPTQAQVDKAYVDLDEAFEALGGVVTVDKTALDAAVTAAEAKVAEKDKYTPASWQKVADALVTAKGLQADTTAKQPTIDAAKDALNKAVADLVLKAVKTDLNTAIQTAEALNGDDYTAETWSKVTAALETAKALQTNENATQQQVNAAVEALNTAIGNLANVSGGPNKAALTLAINRAEAKKAEKDKYTTDSWQAVEDALTAAKNIGADATQEEINAAAKDLNDALDDLVEKGETPITPDTPDKTQLEEAIRKAEALTEADYTAESWKKVSDALTAAKELGENATQEEINAAAKALNDAVETLVRKDTGAVLATPESVTALTNSVNTAAKDYNKANYTAASWSAFEKALKEAQEVLANKDATQAQVDAAKTNLENAIRALQAFTVTKKKATIGLKESFSVKSNGSTYTTSKSNIVKITNAKTGQVKGMKTGTAVVKATNNTTGKITEYTITVKKAPKKISKVTFNKKAIKKKKATLKKGKSATLKVTLPKGTASYKITYTSTKKKIATVDAKGKIKAKKKGKTTITVKTFNKKKMTFTLTVK